MASEPDLRSGQENDPQWVQYLQQLLSHWGYWNGQEDGQFGPEVDEAVKSFQTAQGLVVDGWVGPRTWSVLTQEAVMVNLQDFPELTALAETGGDESKFKQLVASVLQVPDADQFAMADGGDDGSQQA